MTLWFNAYHEEFFNPIKRKFNKRQFLIEVSASDAL